MSQDRRNDFDVTNTVQVSSPASVRNAVHELFAETFPGMSYDKLSLPFYDFERLFTGRYPGYKGCDTTYHDMQHTLDMTLAVARLLVGYERSADVQAAADRLHDELAAAGIDVVLDDRGERPGAMFADWELIGVPWRVVISDRGLKAGTLEVQGRREDQATPVPTAEAAAFVQGRLAA